MKNLERKKSLVSPCFHKTRNQTSKLQSKVYFLAKQSAATDSKQTETRTNISKPDSSTSLEFHKSVLKKELANKTPQTSLITTAPCCSHSSKRILNELRCNLLDPVDSQTERNIVKLIVAFHTSQA